MGKKRRGLSEHQPESSNLKWPLLLAAMLPAVVLAIGWGCVRNASVAPLSTQPKVTQITVKYRFAAWNPCHELLLTYERVGDKNTSNFECKSPGMESSNITEITAEEFNKDVYVSDGFISDPSPYVEIPVSSIFSVPDGTTQCWQTPDEVNTLCCNKDQVVTHEYYDGNKLGILDVNHGRALISYEEK